MPELRKKDLSAFKRSDIDTSKIKYKDKTKEAKRHSLTEEKKRKEFEIKMESKRKSKEERRKKQPKNKKKRTREEAMEEWEGLADDARLLKKLKKGKISKNDFDEEFMIGC